MVNTDKHMIVFRLSFFEEFFVVYPFFSNIWDKVFKNGPSKICGRQPLKNSKGYGLLIKFFKGCLPQILLGPFLNTLSYILFYVLLEILDRIHLTVTSSTARQ